MKNFLDFAEDRLIVLDAHGNFEKEWMDDWMRAFKGNPSEFQPPVAPLESLTEQQRGFLKQVLDNPDPGDFWKLDDPVWTNGAEPPFPHNYWTRGIIAEIDIYTGITNSTGMSIGPSPKRLTSSNPEWPRK